MPLHWTIDSRLRTVDIVADDDVAVADAMAFFDAIEGARALPYNKLLDCTRGSSRMTPDDLMAIVARIRSQHALSPMGALAVVATPEQAQLLARMLGAAAVPDRPLKLFEDLRPARRWLDAQASPSP